MKVEKIKLAVILPDYLVSKIHQKMNEGQYGLREKSKWISEAINSFLDLPNFPYHVEIAGRVRERSLRTNVYITLELDKKLDNAILHVREHYPRLEGVKSLIIRASIIQRLLNLELSRGKNKNEYK